MLVGVPLKQDSLYRCAACRFQSCFSRDLADDREVRIYQDDLVFQQQYQKYGAAAEVAPHAQVALHVLGVMASDSDIAHSPGLLKLSGYDEVMRKDSQLEEPIPSLEGLPALASH